VLPLEAAEDIIK